MRYGGNSHLNIYACDQDAVETLTKLNKRHEALYNDISRSVEAEANIPRKIETQKNEGGPQARNESPTVDAPFFNHQPQISQSSKL